MEQKKINLTNKTLLEDLLNRRPENKIDFNLDRIFQVLESLGNPQNSFKSLHIAGTNGKSSTSIYLSRMLEKMGKKVGRYTSPHITSFFERIQINSQQINENEFFEVYSSVIQVINKYEATISESGDKIFGFFEIITIIAFVIFAQHEVEYAVIEVGIGGRLDATNVLSNKVANIITKIDYEHQDILGNTIEEITYEKAGIIQNDTPVYLLSQQNCVIDIIKSISHKNKAKVDIFTDITVGNYLKTNYNFAKNIVRDILNDDLVNMAYNYNEGFITGHLDVKKIANKAVVLDVSHTIDGACELSKFISGFIDKNKPKSSVAIVAMFMDKNINDFVDKVLKCVDKVILTTNSSDRSYLPKDLEAIRNSSTNKHKIIVQDFDEINIHDLTEDLIVITGSNITVSDFYRNFKDLSV